MRPPTNTSVHHRQGRQPVMASLTISLICGLLVMGSQAFCPSQCQCNDHALEADCAGSRLDVVPILLNPALRSLRLAHNRISTIRQSLDFYADLELLDLSHNTLAGLGQRQLGSQKVLRALNFSYNAIAQLDSHALQGLGQLQVLDLRHNQLTAVEDGSLSELDNLVELDLSENRIERLSDQCFASLVRLRSLNLRANRLQQLAPWPSWTPLAALLSLDLSRNLLAQLDGGDGGLSALIELRQLNLSNNTLHHIHYAAFDGLARLSQLDLSANRLEHVPNDALAPLGASLRLLDLSANYMSQVDAGAFGQLLQLETLRMSDVATLQSIHHDALALLNGTLQTLVLANNRQWRALHPQMLSQLKRLRYVDLSGSGLQTVGQIQDWPPHLEHFDLSGNPLQCNCSMHWLWQHQNRLEHTTNQSSSSSSSTAGFSAPMKDIVCQGPESLVGRRFFQLQESHLLCWTLAQIIIIAIVSALVVVVVTAVALLCCWRHRRLHQKRAPSSSASSSSSGSTTATSHHHHNHNHHLPVTTVLHPHHVKNMTNNMLHQPHLHHHHHHHHHQVGHANHLDQLEQHLHHHNLYQTPDSPPLKSKTLSFPKTVDYFLNDDDYVYHPGGHIKPIPVTAV